MHNNLTRDETHIRFGPSGDTTNVRQDTIISLSEITAPNESLWKLIGDIRGNTTQQYNLENGTKSSINNDDTTIVPSVSKSPAEVRAGVTYRKSKSSSHLNQTDLEKNLRLNETQDKKSQPSVDDNPIQDSSIKRNPEELLNQLHASQKRRPPALLISSEKTIEACKKEIFSLKLQLYNIKSGKQNIENYDIEDVKTDLVQELTAQNERLRKELQERDKRDRRNEQKRKCMLKESSCQTNLDSFNIEELLKLRRTLEKLKDQQRYQQNTDPKHFGQSDSHILLNHHQQHLQQQLQHQQQRHQPTKQAVLKHDKETQFPVISQLNYPHVTPPRTSVQEVKSTSSQLKLLFTDEKMVLERMCYLDGLLTTVKDKLLTSLDTSRLP